MSRYLAHRRLKIVAALAAVLILVPLIGWASHVLALKIARDVRPPARVRYLNDAKPGRIRVETESDGAVIVVRIESNDGTSRTTHYSGGGLPGDWQYSASSLFTFYGRLDREAAPKTVWVTLRPGDVVRLAELTDQGGSPASLTAWCLPHELNADPLGLPEEQYEDLERRRDVWLTAHPPTQP